MGLIYTLLFSEIVVNSVRLTQLEGQMLANILITYELVMEQNVVIHWACDLQGTFCCGLINLFSKKSLGPSKFYILIIHAGNYKISDTCTSSCRQFSDTRFLARTTDCLNALTDVESFLPSHLSRSFAKPPRAVQMVSECIVVMRGYKEVSWKQAKGMMSEANFLKSLTDMDVDGITSPQVLHILKIDDP